jgi:hypothetical protein
VAGAAPFGFKGAGFLLWFFSSNASIEEDGELERVRVGAAR